MDFLALVWLKLAFNLTSMNLSKCEKINFNVCQSLCNQPLIYCKERKRASERTLRHTTFIHIYTYEMRLIS